VNPGTYGLPLRSSVIARRRRRLRILAAVSAAGIFGFVAWVAHAAWPQRADVMAQMSSVLATHQTAGVADAPAPVSERPIYRHSIVPGGAYSRSEVADAIQKDSVVAAHYEEIDVEKLHARRIDVPKAVYVSYRIGETVYWTKNRVTLAAGETVLTDGDNEIRARCGNLLSDVAQEPVAAEDPLAALDVADPAPDTDASSIAGARGPEGRLSHAPFPPGVLGPVSVGGVSGAGAAPPWSGGGQGSSPYLPLGTGTNGTLPAGPRGSTPRTTGSGGGPTGGGEPPVVFVPPTPPGGPETTTGGSVTTTTGDVTTTGGFTTTGDITTTGGVTTTGDTGTTGDIVHTVPEPGVLILLGLGACGLASRAVRARRNRR
jgi:hypothetical protein